MQEWHYTEHSLPDKLVVCWNNEDCLGLCFMLSMNNINFWASCIVSWFNYHHSLQLNSILIWHFSKSTNPDVYSEHVKPSELNLTLSHSSGSRQLHIGRGLDPHQPPAIPFPFYHASYAYFPQQPWPTNLNPVPSTLQPVGLHQNPSGWPSSVKGSTISTWLQYCDNHPDHIGDNLVALATNFKSQSYQMIDWSTYQWMYIHWKSVELDESW